MSLPSNPEDSQPTPNNSEAGASPPGQLRLTPEAKQVARAVSKDMMKDLKSLATLTAKNDNASVIDAKHIRKARQMLAPKYTSLKTRTQKISGTLGGALLGVLLTILYSAVTVDAQVSGIWIAVLSIVSAGLILYDFLD